MAAHPVGSYYWSSVATDPGTLFGGTWERVKDRFILAAGDSYPAGQTGGAASVTSGPSSAESTGPSSAENTGGTYLSIEQMPGHTHKYTRTPLYYSEVQSGVADTIGAAGTLTNSVSADTDWTGGNKAHSHTMYHTHSMAHAHTVTTMPPYTVAYCWLRTA